MKTVQKLPLSKDEKQLEPSIGTVNYYNEFISYFSNTCRLLNRLRQKNVEWNWKESCQRAFESLKEQSCEAKMLVHFDRTIPIVLATDASSYGLRAVIMHRCIKVPHRCKKAIQLNRRRSSVEYWVGT